LGWLAFSGQIEQRGDTISARPTSASRSRVFLAPLGLWLILDAGQFERVDFDPESGDVTLHLDPAKPNLAAARLRIEQTAKAGERAPYRPRGTLSFERGSWIVPLGQQATPLGLMRAE
jgi:hypothetical protein